MKLRTVAVHYTSKCPLRCRHCITESSPTVEGRMGLERGRRCLSGIRKISDSVCFTGGEPLIYYKDIVSLVDYCATLGFEQIMIVTGAGWVRSKDRAKLWINELRRVGLTVIGISWDQYHEEFRAVNVIRMLAEVSIEAGLKVIIRLVFQGDRENAQDEHYKKVFDGLPVTLSAQRVAPLGRAAAALPEDHFYYTHDLPKAACSMVYRGVVDHKGDVFVCCGPAFHSRVGSPLRLGNADQEPIEVIFQRALADPLLQIIAAFGPYGLWRLLWQTENYGLYQRRARYNNICDLCLDLTNKPEIVCGIRSALSTPVGIAYASAARLKLSNSGSHWRKGV